MEVIPSTPQEVPEIPPHNYSPITVHTEADAFSNLDEPYHVNFVVYGPEPFDGVEVPAADPAAIESLSDSGSEILEHGAPATPAALAPVDPGIANSNCHSSIASAITEAPITPGAEAPASASIPSSNAAQSSNPEGVNIVQIQFIM